MPIFIILLLVAVITIIILYYKYKKNNILLDVLKTALNDVQMYIENMEKDFDKNIEDYNELVSEHTKVVDTYNSLVTTYNKAKDYTHYYEDVCKFLLFVHKFDEEGSKIFEQHLNDTAKKYNIENIIKEKSKE